MTPRFFEDFEVGQRFVTRGVTLTEAAMVDFALAWDPQPIHVDRVAAERSPYGGLIASGFHTLSLAFRLVVDLGFLAECGIGSPGMDEVRWHLPVRPGDTLSVEVEVIEARASGSRPERGGLRTRQQVRNQRGEVVMSFVDVLLVRRRPAAEDLAR